MKILKKITCFIFRYEEAEVMKMKKILKTGIVSWVLLILAWYFASRIVKPDFLASPLTTLISMKELIKNNTLQGHIIASMSRVLKGWSIGVIMHRAF